MVGEAFAGLSAFSSMFSIAKSMKDMNDAVVRNQAVYELWEQILAAQQRYTAAIEKINELEAEIARSKAWEVEKNRYHMKDYGGGTIAYQLKQGMEGNEPAHRICPSCYQHGHKGILQTTGVNAYRQETVKCAECGKDFALGPRVERNIRVRSDYDPFTGQ
jgi:hypothetical protein